MSLVMFGLTGGLASGKSTVAARFRELGVPVIDADMLAREVVRPGSEGLRAVTRLFGDGVLLPDGALDRAKLATIVFQDAEKRRLLGAVVHPLIGALTAERAAELDAQGVSLACYEAALLVETGVADRFRPLVVVALPEDVQVARAAARDGVTLDEARARVAAQMPLAAKIAVADHVIDNEGDRAQLELRAEEVLSAIRASILRRK